MLLSAFVVLHASLSFRKKFNIIVMTSLSVDINTMQRASASSTGERQTLFLPNTGFFSEGILCPVSLIEIPKTLYLPISRSCSDKADYVGVLQRTLEYKKFGLLHVHHASLSVIFTLSALTRTMFVANLGSDRSCPLMQEDVKTWLFCHTGHPSLTSVSQSLK